MRALLVVEPGIDGAFRHVEGLAEHLLGRGHRVDLAYSSRRGSAGLHALVRRVEAAGGTSVDLRVGNGPAPRDAVAAARLLALVRRRRPLGLLRGVPLVYTPHAYYGMGGATDARTRVFTSVERRLARVGRTIVISPDEARFAQERLGVPAGSLTVAHNPVDLSRFAPADAAARVEARAALGLPAHAVVVGTMGRMSAQKDPATLYRALAPLLAAHDEVWLCHVGQGDLAPELDALARDLGLADRRRVLAHLDRPAAFFHAVDLFALSPVYEAGWPLVVLEAMAAGLPLVVTSAPGTTDLAAAGLSHCWTAPAGDVPALTGALEAWWADRCVRRPCDHREQAARRFSPDRLYGEVEAVYGS